MKVSRQNSSRQVVHADLAKKLSRNPSQLLSLKSIFELQYFELSYKKSFVDMQREPKLLCLKTFMVYSSYLQLVAKPQPQPHQYALYLYFCIYLNSYVLSTCNCIYRHLHIYISEVQGDEVQWVQRNPLSNQDFLKIRQLSKQHHSIDRIKLRIQVLGIQSPVKSSNTKIIYALHLIHVMLSRNYWRLFMRSEIFFERA